MNFTFTKSLLISKTFEFNVNLLIHFSSSTGYLIKMKESIGSLTNNGTILKRKKKAKYKLKIFTAPTPLGIDIHSLEYCMFSRKYYI